jgi:hypothetical protein
VLFVTLQILLLMVSIMFAVELVVPYPRYFNLFYLKKKKKTFKILVSNYFLNRYPMLIIISDYKTYRLPALLDRRSQLRNSMKNIYRVFHLDQYPPSLIMLLPHLILVFKMVLIHETNFLLKSC